jgi:hypothetical protein
MEPPQDQEGIPDFLNLDEYLDDENYSNISRSSSFNLHNDHLNEYPDEPAMEPVLRNQNEVEEPR